MHGMKIENENIPCTYHSSSIKLGQLLVKVLKTRNSITIKKEIKYIAAVLSDEHNCST